jgi:nucleotide-binding universal stress UspA family protein
MPGLIVGYDGSEHAKAALRTAVDLAGRLGVGVTVAFGFDANPVGGEALDYWAALREHGQGLLAEAIADAKAAGVEADSVLAEEAPAKALSELARERGAEMIVLGSAGERPLVGALLGSTPQKLIHLAGVPVLVVRAE